MLIKEYRIMLPLTVDEYEIARRYMKQRCARKSEFHEESCGTNVITNVPYDNGPSGAGHYSFKMYPNIVHLPEWAHTVLPSCVPPAHEEVWDAFPHVKTRTTCPKMKRFSVGSETRYFNNDFGAQNNVFGLNGEELRSRKVVMIDFVNDRTDLVDYSRSSEDPRQFRSQKTGRGPLYYDWLEECRWLGRPVMCVYKLCRVEFRYWGLQKTIERWIHKSLRPCILRAHRRLWTLQDGWVGLTMADIRRMEAEAYELKYSPSSKPTGNDNADYCTKNDSADENDSNR